MENVIAGFSVMLNATVASELHWTQVGENALELQLNSTGRTSKALLLLDHSNTEQTVPVQVP